MEKVHVRFLRYSAFYTPLLLTLEGDGLKKEGIAATFDKVTPQQSIEAGLRDGTVHVAQSAPAVSFLPAVHKEAPAYRHFALMNSRDGFFIGARDRNAPFSWASLEDKTVLVDHFFQPMALFRTALRRNGVDERRVRIVDAGDVAGIEAAFRAGQGDFVHMQGPAPQQLEQEGLCRVVASVGEAAGPLAFSSLCARPEWLATDVARAFMRVYRRGRALAREMPSQELARMVAPFLPGIAEDALTTTIAAYQRMGTWAGDERISPELYERTVDIFVDVGHISARPAMLDVVAEPPAP